MNTEQLNEVNEVKPAPETQHYIIYFNKDDFILSVLTQSVLESSPQYKNPYFIAKIPMEVFQEPNHYKFTLNVVGEEKTFSYKEKTELELRLEELIDMAERYAYSSEVDGIYIGDDLIVFDEVLRDKLKDRLSNEEMLGNDTLTLYFNGKKYEGKVADYKKMLFAISIRSDKNFDNLQYHIHEMQKISDIETLNSYDYTSGYQPALRL